jgi:hypothetical protein
MTLLLGILITLGAVILLLVVIALALAIGEWMESAGM